MKTPLPTLLRGLPIPAILLPLLLVLCVPSAFGAGTWDGGGANALWSTQDNWDDNTVPAAGADVTFGSAFTSGSAINLSGNREVGALTFNHGATAISLNNNTLQINTGISRTASGNSDIFSAVSLPGDITITSSAGGRIRFGGVISGTGNIDFTNTTTAGSLQLDGNNTGWSGGLTLQAGVVNSVVNVFNTNALGTGDVVWKAGTSGPVVVMNGSYTINNNFAVEGTGDRAINPFNVASGTGGITAFNGNITGTDAATIRFQPRQTDITGHYTELNGVNTNANVNSRMIFFGSTHNSTSALGNTYLIGNDGALGWGRVILGQSSVNKDDVAMLYKDGITISRLVEINDDDPADVTMGTYGTNASSTQSGTIQLTSFATAKTKQLNLFADTGSQFTVSGNITVPGVGDVLNVTKTGDGAVSLTNAAGTQINGTTIVSAGTLLIANSTGSGLGTSNVTVNSGSLGGSGSFTGSVTVNAGGTLAPGSSIESLASGSLTLNNASTFAYEVDSAAAPSAGADLQIVSGNLSLNGTVTLTLDNLSVGTFGVGTTFSLINYDGTWNNGVFTFNSVALNNLDQFLFNGQQWQIEYDATSGGLNFTGDYLPGSSFVNMTVVPEPSTGLLLAAALLLPALRRGNRRK